MPLTIDFPLEIGIQLQPCMHSPAFRGEGYEDIFIQKIQKKD